MSKTTNKSIRIIVGQRGWVHVGRVVQEDPDGIVMESARCIRRWGTPGKGLAYLAQHGPQSETVLDEPAPTYRIHPLAVVHQYDCATEAWEGKL